MEKIDLFGLIRWFTAILVFIISLRYTIRHFRAVRTLSFLERFNGKNMRSTLDNIRKWSESGSLKKRKKSLAKDDVLYGEAMIVYNLLTEVAIANRFKILHPKLFKTAFDPLYIIWYLRIYALVEYRNDIAYNGEKVIGININKLYERMLKHTSIKNIQELKNMYEVP